MLHDVAATLLLPAAHLFICYSLGITRDLRYLKVLLLLLILLIPDLSCLIVNATKGHVMGREAMFNYLNFTFFGGQVFRLQMYSVIVIAQLCIEMQRIMVLRRIFEVRKLSFKPGAKVVIFLAITMCFWVLLTILPPHELYANPLYNMIMEIGYSVLVTALVPSLVLFFDRDAVVDSDNKPVDLNNDADSTLAEDIRMLIERDQVYLNSALRIEELATMLGTNRTYLARAFRLKFGGTFTEVMTRYRLEHAKRLMRENPKLLMEEVALDSGFSSSNFFGRVFKMQEGMTPSQWRSGATRSRHAAPAERSVSTAPVVPKVEGMTTEEALGLSRKEVNDLPKEILETIESKGSESASLDEVNAKENSVESPEK